MRSFFRDNGLTIALTVLFGMSIIGMAAAGFNSFNAELAKHGEAPVSLTTYLTGGAISLCALRELGK